MLYTPASTQRIRNYSLVRNNWIFCYGFGTILQAIGACFHNLSLESKSRTGSSTA
ncbi:hypothetical protein RchiOBHm_Chr4g0404771 [Rosa chinensis]|uniref:Uncharacterized protein n=1 Tax=Rosa chinensis TaxID=74649 RepID=A0A2P6QTW6_ROSCH|nr:hypothetical protein RchiOBHm_Chr4g0404771 [Rosa chinensis]